MIMVTSGVMKKVMTSGMIFLTNLYTKYMKKTPSITGKTVEP